MSSPSKNPLNSGLDDPVSDEIACLNDVRLPDTSESLLSWELAATVENYQVHSSDPIVGCVSEDDRLTMDIGSPVTNSDSPTAAETTANITIGVRAAAALETVDDSVELVEDVSTQSSSVEDIPQTQVFPMSATDLCPGESQQRQQMCASSVPSSSNSAIGTAERVPPAGKSQLRRVDSVEWPDDDVDEDEAERLFSKFSKESPDKGSSERAPLRTHFEATFEQPDRLSQRVIHKFDVTYDAKEASFAASPTIEPEKQEKMISTFAREEKCQLETSDEVSTDTSSPDQSLEVNKTSVAVGFSQQEVDVNKMDSELYDDELLLRLGNEGNEQAEKQLGAAAQDADLFQRLLEKLDTMMAGLKSSGNTKTAVGLVSKGFEKRYSGKAQTEKAKLPMVSNEWTTYEAPAPEEAADLLVRTSIAAAAEAAAKAALAAIDSRQFVLTSSSVLSNQDTLSRELDTVQLHAVTATSKSQNGEQSTALTDETAIGDVLHQVYSNYLAENSNEKLKRQIGTHYLRQLYDSAEERFADPEELKLQEQRRLCQLENNRFSIGLFYCSYLLPLAFVIFNLSAMALFSYQILASKTSEFLFWLVMYGLTVATGGICYFYNIFAAETHNI